MAIPVAAHRALAEPTRVRILEELRSGDLDVSTLAARLGLHISTIRAHMVVLGEAGMVTSRPERTPGRGRPKTIYSLALGSLNRPSDGYKLLAKALVRQLAAGSRDPRAAAEAAGEELGRRMTLPGSGTTTDEAIGRMMTLLSDGGYDPEAVRADRRLEIFLHRCPFREAVEENQDVVCSVHLGLLRGALREMGAPIEARRLRPLVAPSLCVVDLEHSPKPGQAGHRLGSAMTAEAHPGR